MDPKLRDQSRAGALDRAGELLTELFDLRTKRRFRQLENTNLPKVRRRERARLLTLIREDELGLRALAPEGTVSPKAKAQSKVPVVHKPLVQPKVAVPGESHPDSPATHAEKGPRPSRKKRGLLERIGIRRSRGQRGGGS